MSKDATGQKTQIYERILHKVVNNEYPRDEFLTESALVNEFGVSRILIREILIELRKDRILKSVPRAGYQIVQLTTKEIEDAISTRAVIETGAGRLACDRLTDEEINYLKELEARATEARQAREHSLRDWWQTNTDFHRTIVEAAGNNLLTEMAEQTTSILWRGIVQYFIDRDPSAYHGFQPGTHRRIIEAIEAGHREKLVAAIEEDVTGLATVFRVGGTSAPRSETE